MERENGFWPAIRDFFFRAGDFKGVSSRAQYWWVFLVEFLLGVVIVGLFRVTDPAIGQTTKSFGDSLISTIMTSLPLIFVYLSYPQLSLTIRRFRDAKVSPWWYLVLVIVALAGPVLTVSGMGIWPIIVLPLVAGLADLIVLVLPSREQEVKSFPVQPHSPSTIGVSFGAAVKDLFLRGGDFTGTSSRSQYWWSVLFDGLIIVPTFLFVIFSLVAAFIGAATLGKFEPQDAVRIFNSLGSGAIILVMLIMAIVYAWSMLALPMLTVIWRRFRDAGVSPWWFIAFYVVSNFVSALQASNPNFVLTLIPLILAIVQIVILALPPKNLGDQQ
ncbi:DUF805 domain-containing protein [Lacticaseibacillus parahuelsenbergensis]|uniref:DUF805 domain-containing protein n=1 Tax=Lacticaseibacillus parahuelsenbergensis TaxID=3068305 RepID=A0ABY9L385_9LACO|nr:MULTISPECIES: DUF805 domain-containing protein [Lacticaseibacillus]MDE3281282.1 DUF805 domain-containing protein [Lacticaseibacillus casei]WLV78208.1 DUF805 domain-containing protein [Lacticaseibacillus sp. NCIMB 15471]